MPFSSADFFAIFAEYNIAIWPLQIVVYLAGLLVVALVYSPSRTSEIVILLLLSAMWAINGIGYHLLHFASVNPAAKLFAVLFLAQSALFGAAPFIWPQGIFGEGKKWLRKVAVLLMLFALVGYPAVGFLAGHRYPAVPVFGVAPCPTTIFSLGVIVLSRWSVARWLLIVPMIWVAIGGSAALLLNVPQDYSLILSGLVVATLAFIERQRHDRTSQ